MSAPNTAETLDLVSALRPDDHVRGPTDAPVILVEYGDFECPFCAAAVPVLRDLEQRFGDNLCTVFRHNPRSFDHPHARKAAEAAEAAAAQGKFWQMHDLLFLHQNALEIEHLVEYAKQLDLNVEEFRRDLTSEAHRARVHTDELTGVQYKVISTPTFFINRDRYSGRAELSELTMAIENARD